MRVGLLFLMLGYVLSQFYRAFLPVMAPLLAVDIGAGADDLARASGLWFLAFAVMQIPVGWALDRVGPRLTASVLLAVGGCGAAVFGFAQGPGAVDIAMVLIGIGCSPVLMSAYYLFARIYSARMFGTLAGVSVGVGSLGNLAGSVPLAWAVQSMGWRPTMLALAGATLLVALAVARFVQDPPAVPAGGPQGSLWDLLKMPALWLILPMMAATYGPAAGVRALWIGPYLSEVYGLDAAGIGRATLVMALAMIAGNFAYGPLDRLFRSRKWVVMAGTLLGLACFIALWAAPDAGLGRSTLLLAGVGFFGASFPMIMAHGRALLPPHLTGRGVTLINLFGIGGAGLMQVASGRLHSSVVTHATTAAAPYAALFAGYAAILLAGCAVYLFCADRTD